MSGILRDGAAGDVLVYCDREKDGFGVSETSGKGTHVRDAAFEDFDIDF